MGTRRHTRVYCCSAAVLMAAVAAHGQAQDVAFVATGVSIGFQNAGNSTVGAGVSIGFQNAGDYAIGAGVSISFANASSTEGRGVSIAFGALPPPTQPPPASTTLGAPGTTTNRTMGVAEPVNTATGNYYNSPVDLTAPGKGLSFVFTRSYNSQDSYSGPMGVGWTHSYNISLTVDTTSGVIAVKHGDGHQEYYAPLGGGKFAPRTLGLFNTLTQNADGSFALTFKNQNQFHFSSTGTLIGIADRNGNTQTLNYDGNGHLTSIVDASGRAFNLAYDGSGRVISLSDPLGRTLQYA